jgi:hypothetical protein
LRHRALFDAPMPQNVLDLAARYLDNIRTVYGNHPGHACAVLNLWTRAVYMTLGDALWRNTPSAKTQKSRIQLTRSTAPRNINWRISEADTAAGYGSIEVLLDSGAIVLVCDFALSHLATRLANAGNANRETVHAELRTGLIKGAILVPSGIFAAGEARNAGCAFIPA